MHPNSASNAYTGSTTISGGVLEVTKLADGGANSSIGASSNTATNLLFSGPNVTLRYTGSGDSTNRLFRLAGNATIESSGLGAVNFTNSGETTRDTSTRTLTFGGNNAGNNTFAPLLSSAQGPATLTKSGDGKWILTNNNTYTGGTVVSSGTLLINGSHTGGGDYSVTGVLGGSGTIRLAATRTTTVNSGGSIAPGANLGQIGTLTFNGVTQTGTVANFSSGASFTFDLNATSETSDQIALINGAANDFVFNDNVINFTVLGSLGIGQSYVLFSSNVANAYSGLTFDGSNRVSDGLTF